MATRQTDKNKSTDIADYFDVSDQDLESTLEHYLEESETRPKSKPLNFVTMLGLSILAICMVMVLQLFVPFKFDFEPILTAILIGGGITVGLVGFGMFGREKRAKRKKKKTVVLSASKLNAGTTDKLDQYALTRKKRLFKSRTNRKIFGVCGGLAEYFGVDAMLVRILFAAFIFLGYGSSLVLYMVMALILPVKPKELDS